MLTAISIQNLTKPEEFLTPVTALPPLPIEAYPRILELKKRKWDYYIILVVVLSIRLITPLSAIYLIAFPVIVPRLRGAPRIGACSFAAYALVEVIFAAYYLYLIRQVQSRPVGGTVTDDSRDNMVHQILAMDLSSSRTGWSTTGIYGDHTATMANLGSDLTLAEGCGEGDGMSEKSEKPASLSASSHRATGRGTEKFDQSDSLADEAAVEFRERLRTWFNHAPWESLKRDNILVWLSWVCLGLPLGEARKNEKHIQLLNNTLGRLEERTGYKIPEGFNPDITVQRLTLDPVIIKMRPLILYAVPAIFNAYLRIFTFPSWGLRTYSDGEIDYLVRIPPGWNPSRSKDTGLPVIYLHGLGFGLVTSYALIKSLIKSLPDQPLLIPLQPHTSQSISHPRHLKPWTRGELVGSISRTCTKFGFWTPATDDAEAQGGCSILSHSNGSVPHSWIIKDIPSLALRNTFVDPIVFCIWEGDMTHSVCYRKPTTGMELLMSYLIASEIGISLYIRRHFDWTENTLFFEEIPAGLDHTRTVFFLGGKDMVIDAPRARKYLESHGVTGRSLHWNPNRRTWKGITWRLS